jgi:hypothetical protein
MGSFYVLIQDMGGRHLRRLLPVLAAIAVAACTAALAGAAAPGSWTGLAGGRVGDYLWTVKAKRQGGEAGAGPLGAQRPCLLIGTTWEIGPYSYRRSKFRNCVDPAGRITTSEPPLIASAVQPTSGSVVKMTAVGMIFPAAARRARVSFSDGTRSTIRLERLSPEESHAAGLGQLRYAAFAVHGRWCPERVVSQDGSGRVLWDSGTETYACGVELPAMLARP